MGLFDFFRKKKPVSPQASEPKSGGRLTQDEFARKFMDALQAASMEGLSYNAEEFSIHVSQANSRFFLGNAYDEYNVAPDDEARDRVIIRYVQNYQHGLPATPDSWDEARESVMPLVRSRNFLERLNLQLLTEDAKRVPWQILAESFALCLGHDTPTALNYINKEQLGKWGVTYEEAMAQALENLAARSAQNFVEQEPGLFRSPWQDCHDSARLVLPEIFKRLNLAGKAVITVPHWNALFVADSANGDALRKLAKVTETEMQQPRNNNSPALILGNGGWQPFVPPPDHPAYKPLLRLKTIARVRDYGEAGPSLQQQLGQDVYVGNIGTMHPKNDPNALCTYATWGDGIATALPKVDWIAMVDTSKPGKDNLLGLYAWGDVAVLVPGMQEPLPDQFPAYFRVEKFPLRDQIKQLTPKPQ